MKSDGFRQAAETFGELRSMVDEGSPGRNWNDATNMVITGKAGMQIMGDWAKGEFIAAGLTAGEEYGCKPLPATTATSWAATSSSSRRSTTRRPRRRRTSSPR